MSESDSSDEYYQSSQKKAFKVDIPKNFDPKSPITTGEEYLQHVVFHRKKQRHYPAFDAKVTRAQPHRVEQSYAETKCESASKAKSTSKSELKSPSTPVTPVKNTFQSAFEPEYKTTSESELKSPSTLIVDHVKERHCLDLATVTKPDPKQVGSLETQTRKEMSVSDVVRYLTRPVPKAPEFCKPSEEWQLEKLKDFKELKLYMYSKTYGVSRWDRRFGKSKFLDHALEKPPVFSDIAKYSEKAKIEMIRYITAYLNSLKPGETMSKIVGAWTYAIMVALDDPPLPNDYGYLRELAVSCGEVRANLSNSATKSEYTQLNLFICLVAGHYRQTDLKD